LLKDKAMPTMTSLKRVLVVDDDRMHRTVLTFNLRQQGFEVVSASGVDEALQLADQTAFDLVVTDYYMPGLTGGDLIRRLRDTEIHGDVPIVLISGKERNSDMETLYRNAHVYVFPKPCSVRKVVDTAVSCLTETAAAN
jgi:two-component system phosphate regulon response regulator PhoB